MGNLEEASRKQFRASQLFWGEFPYKNKTNHLQSRKPLLLERSIRLDLNFFFFNRLSGLFWSVILTLPFVSKESMLETAKSV